MIFPFLSLPRELRDMIYEYTLDPADLAQRASCRYATYNDGDHNTLIRTPTILLLNRQVAEEFACMYRKQPITIDLASLLSIWSKNAPTDIRPNGETPCSGRVHFHISRRLLESIQKPIFVMSTIWANRPPLKIIFEPAFADLIESKGVLVGYKITHMNYLQSTRRDSTPIHCTVFSDATRGWGESEWELVCNEDYRGVGHAIDRFVNAINRRFSCPPLLNHDFESFFKLRRARGKVLSRKTIAPSFEGHSDLRSMYSGSFAERERRPSKTSRRGGMF